MGSVGFLTKEDSNFNKTALQWGAQPLRPSGLHGTISFYSQNNSSLKAKVKSIGADIPYACRYGVSLKAYSIQPTAYSLQLTAYGI